MKKWEAKTILILIIMCLTNQVVINTRAQEAYQEVPFRIPPPYNGEKNDVDPSLIGIKYAQEITNAYIDETGGTTKRRGSKAYDNTQGSSGTVLNQWPYTKETGEQYFLRVVGSTLSYSIGDGNWTILVSTLNPNYIPDQVTFLNWNIITNGIDDVYMWQGPGTLVSSATFTKFRYIDAWEGRLIGAGVTGYRASFYYGAEDEIFNAGFGSTNLGLGGRVITGLAVKGNAWIFTNKGIWAAIWKYEFGIDQATQFVIRKLTDEVGCLYDTSIQDFNDGLMFFSHLGWVHMKAGAEGAMTYRVVSRNIDGTLEGIDQKETSEKSIWITTTAEDFGAGAFVSIHCDTTTTPGSIIPSYHYLNQEMSKIVAGAYQDLDDYQTFKSSFTGIVTRVGAWHQTLAAGTYSFRIWDGDLTEGATTSKTLSIGQGWTYYDFNVYITSGTTYKIGFAGDYSTTISWLTSGAGTGPYARGQGFYNGAGQSWDYAFRVYVSTVEYHSEQKSVVVEDDFFQMWGRFESTDNGEDIDYYIRIATASANLSLESWAPISNDDQIAFSSGPHIQVKTVLKSTAARVDDFTVNFYADNTAPPIPSMVYDDRYIAVITTATMTKNGLVLVCNSDFAWTRQVYTGIYPYSMAVYRDVPYFGDTDTGWTHEIDVEDIYDDNGYAYPCRILTGDLDFGYPNNEKVYARAYTKAENSGRWTLDWGYNFNGSTQSITCDKKVGLGIADRIINCRTFFPREANEAYYIKLQLQNNSTNQWFDWRGTDVYYRVPVEPLR